MFDEKMKGQQSVKVRAQTVNSMIKAGKLTVAQERYFRMRYGISEDPSYKLERIPMPAKTARVVEGLEAMLVSREDNNPQPSSLKRETIIDKLRRSQN